MLGQEAEQHSGQSLQSEQLQQMDQALEQLYTGDRQGRLGDSAPKINRWLGDIRRYFPSPVVQILQRDAFQRLNIERMLLEPELLSGFEPDIHLVSTLLNLKQTLPARSRETAKVIIRRLVEQLLQRLQLPLQQAVRGSISRQLNNRRPKLREIHWGRTIQRNLKHYQPEYQSIIPQELHGYGHKRKRLKEVVLCVDQSGSMGTSVVYAGVLASVLAALPSLKTRLILFDTKVLDMSEQLHDPVELLFGVQLGVGTDIQRALAYIKAGLQNPEETILVLISDLYEGAAKAQLYRQVRELLQMGVQFISLLALNDEGSPAFDPQVAGELAKLGIPVFACTPEQFPPLMAAALQGQDLEAWLAREGILRRS